MYANEKIKIKYNLIFFFLKYIFLITVNFIEFYVNVPFQFCLQSCGLGTIPLLCALLQTRHDLLRTLYPTTLPVWKPIIDACPTNLKYIHVIPKKYINILISLFFSIKYWCIHNYRYADHIPPSQLFKWALNLNNKQDAHGPHRSLEKQFKSINTFAQTKITLQCWLRK